MAIDIKKAHAEFTKELSKKQKELLAKKIQLGKVTKAVNVLNQDIQKLESDIRVLKSKL